MSRDNMNPGFHEHNHDDDNMTVEEQIEHLNDLRGDWADWSYNMGFAVWHKERAEIINLLQGAPDERAHVLIAELTLVIRNYHAIFIPRSADRDNVRSVPLIQLNPDSDETAPPEFGLAAALVNSSLLQDGETYESILAIALDALPDSGDEGEPEGIEFFSNFVESIIMAGSSIADVIRSIHEPHGHGELEAPDRGLWDEAIAHIMFGHDEQLSTFDTIRAVDYYDSTAGEGTDVHDDSSDSDEVIAQKFVADIDQMLSAVLDKAASSAEPSSPQVWTAPAEPSPAESISRLQARIRERRRRLDRTADDGDGAHDDT